MLTKKQQKQGQTTFFLAGGLDGGGEKRGLSLISGFVC
jgi:hypothetical protein